MYIVYINGREVARVATPDEVWDTIGKHPFGSLYSVDNTDPETDLSQFIPF